MSVLKGPADADHYRVRVGRYGDRWYTDPLPTCPIAEASDWQGPSWSIVKGAAGKDWSFVANKRNAHAPTAELERIAKLEPTERAQAFNAINKNMLNQAAGRGTIVHLWAEDLLAGRTPRQLTDIDLLALRLPKAALEEALTYKAAIVEFFDAHQPEVVAAEYVAIHRTINGVGYGCTPDVVARIAGQLVGIDWKSRGVDSDHGAYPEEAAQIAAGARAEYMIIVGDDGQPCRARLPQIDHGIVVSIKPDGCRVYPVDLDKAFTHVEAMHSFWVARRSESDSIGKPWAPKASPAGGADSPNSNVADDTAPPVDEFTITTTDGRRKPVTITYTREGIRARIAKLIDNGHEELVRSMWPPGVPPLSKPGHSVEQLTALMHMMMRAESETSATFHEDDTPIPDRPPDVELLATPPRVELDEGGPITPEQKDALEAAFNALNDNQKMRLGLVTKEAADAGRPLSVSLHPTQRRWAIAQALIHWIAHGPAALHHLFVAASMAATDEQTADANQTLGALISTFTIEQANRLHDSLDTTVAA